MSRRAGASSPLGTEALFHLCNRVPVHRFCWAVEPLPWHRLIEQQGKLRARLWRRVCKLSSHGEESCADRGLACHVPESCIADRWLPLPSGSGAESWRMATLFVRHYPQAGRLVAWVLGNLDEAGHDAIRGLLRPWLGDGAPDYREGRLLDFSPARPGHHRIELVTPWVLDKADPARRTREVEDFSVRLLASLERRMQKFAVLATAQPGMSMPVEARQLIGFSARYIATRLLPGAAHIQSASLSVSAFGVPSGSNGKLVPHVVADAGGHFIADLAEAALPWLGLLAIAGGGKSADKGFGGIEISAC